MPWESRGNNRYYYRKRRIGDRVVSEYVGAGAIAEWLAEMDEEERQERLDELNRKRKEREEHKAIDDKVNNFGDAVRMLTKAAMLVNGYHAHKGQWRKKRDE